MAARVGQKKSIGQNVVEHIRDFRKEDRKTRGKWGKEMKISGNEVKETNGGDPCVC